MLSLIIILLQAELMASLKQIEVNRKVGSPLSALRELAVIEQHVEYGLFKSTTLLSKEFSAIQPKKMRQAGLDQQHDRRTL